MHTPDDTHVEHKALTWSEVGLLIDSIAETLTWARDDGEQYAGILAIPRGGFPVGVAVSNRLTLPLISRLEDVYTLPNGTIIVADDICDTGTTLIKFAQSLRGVARRVDLVALVGKHAGIRNLTMRGLCLVNKYQEAFDDVWIHFPWESPHNPTR